LRFPKFVTAGFLLDIPKKLKNFQKTQNFFYKKLKIE